MTTIIAASWGGSACIGADSNGTDGTVSQPLVAKVFETRLGYYGYSGSYLSGETVASMLNRSENDVSLELGHELREEFKRLGWRAEEKGSIAECSVSWGILLTWKRTIYVLQPEVHFLRVRAPYATTGSGWSIAAGAMETFSKATKKRPTPELAVRSALRVAIKLNPGSGGRPETWTI